MLSSITGKNKKTWQDLEHSQFSNIAYIAPHAGQNGYHPKINKQRVLVRMQREWNPCALLVRMQIGAATMESSMEIPHKIKNGSAFDPVIQLWEYI